jgi:tRNA A37 N6-isopentenylltransferase MiaA
MKALKFLKHIKQTDTQYNFLECEINKAIEELEEAMKPKTCEWCSNLFFDEIEKVYKCSNDVSDDVGYLHGEAVIRNIKDFHCVQHQPKDNA